MRKIGIIASDTSETEAHVIDEAPQYVPFDPKGIAKDTTDIIINLCALGG